MFQSLREGRIGRIPIWGVGLALAGLIVLFAVIRKRKARGDSSFSSVPSDSIEGVPTSDLVDQISGNYPSTTPTAPLPDQPKTNQQWLMASFDYLTSLSYEPLKVQAALQKYLAGSVLTPEESDYVNKATAAFNLPPEGVSLPGTGGTGGTGGNDIPQTLTPPIGQDLYVWVKQQQALYPSLGLDFYKLFGKYTNDPNSLNPTARKYIDWPAGPGGKTPVFVQGAPAIRIR